VGSSVTVGLLLQIFPDSDNEITSKIGEYLMKLRRTKMVPIFGPPCRGKKIQKLECGLMPKVMAALPNIGGDLCTTPQSLADAHYYRDVQ